MSELDTALVRRTEDGNLTERDLAIFALQDRIARQASHEDRSLDVAIHNVSREDFDKIAAEDVRLHTGVRVKREHLAFGNIHGPGSIRVVWFLDGEDA